MENQKEILQELKELKGLIAKLIGSGDLPLKDQLSEVTIDKAGKDIRTLVSQENK